MQKGGFFREGFLLEPCNCTAESANLKTVIQQLRYYDSLLCVTLLQRYACPVFLKYDL